MARDGSGTYSLPNPAFVYDTVIDETKVNGNFTDVSAALTQSLSKDGQTIPTANLPMGGFKMTGLGTPTAATDAATKGYAESYTDTQIAAVQAGLFWKEPVLNATTANVALSGEQTIDGVLTSASRILVKNQTAPAENGIYVTAAGAWARATSLDTWAEHVGAAVMVSQGTANSDTSWNCTVDAGGTLGTTAITWAQWGGLTSAGAGLQETAGVVSVKEMFVIVACSDEVTVIDAGTGKTEVVIPVAFTVTGVGASLTTAQTSGAIFTVDINESGTSILSTKITIDNTEKTSETAVTAAVISNSMLAAGAVVTFDVDQVGDITATGLKVWIKGYAA